MKYAVTDEQVVLPSSDMMAGGVSHTSLSLGECVHLT